MQQETGNLEASLEQLEMEFGDENESRKLQRLGLDVPEVRDVLRCLSEIGDGVTFEEIEVLVDYGIGKDTLQRSLEWAELLHLVRRVGRNAWRMDPVAARYFVGPVIDE